MEVVVVIKHVGGNGENCRKLWEGRWGDFGRREGRRLKKEE